MHLGLKFRFLTPENTTDLTCHVHSINDTEKYNRRLLRQTKDPYNEPDQLTLKAEN